jgi:hypothetical protein
LRITHGFCHRDHGDHGDQRRARGSGHRSVHDRQHLGPGRGARRCLPRPGSRVRRDAVLTASGTGHDEPPGLLAAARGRANLRDRIHAGRPSYLLGPKSAACQGGLASADDGESMTATSGPDRSEAVTMTIQAGGVGPSTDLACPYIPAVYAADQALRQGFTFCAHPSADVIRQIPTGTASLYAAAVLVQPG